MGHNERRDLGERLVDSNKRNPRQDETNSVSTKQQLTLLRLSFRRLVYVRHISRVVLIVVKLHGGSINVWFQCFKRVGKVRDRVCFGRLRAKGEAGRERRGTLFEQGTTRVRRGAIVWDDVA